MKRKWRVVTNSEWYELEYKYWWSLWMRYHPHQFDKQANIFGYTPHEESDYKFNTIQEARARVKEITRDDQLTQFKPVMHDISEGIHTVYSNPAPMPRVSEPLQEGKTRSNVKKTKGYTEAPPPPPPQSVKKMEESKGSYVPQATAITPTIMTTKTKGMQAATTIRRVTEQKGPERAAKCGYDLFMGITQGDFHERHESWLNYLDRDYDIHEERNGIWVPAISL